MGIIMGGSKNSRLKEISLIRSVSAIPVGGKYRAIDFILSNMVNSAITNIGVLAQYSFRSLMDHLGSGKEWDLDRRKNGLYIFPPYLSDEDTGWYRGSADALYKNLSFLEKSDEDYVMIASGNCIFKMNFDKIQEFHLASGADVTMLYREMNDFSTDDLSLLGIITLDSSSRVIDIQEKPQNPLTKNGSMGIYYMKRSLLISLLKESAAHADYDLLMDVFIKKLDSLKIFGYRFDGYWRNLSTIQMYYDCNMDMLNPDIRHELFIQHGKTYTKVKDEAPAKYNDEAEVKNSIIADGCIIEGDIQNSVLFRGVKVKKGARIRDSIIMQGSIIEEAAKLQNVILDKNVTITYGKCLKGEKTWPLIVSKNVIV